MAKKDITNKEHIIIVLLLIFRFINSKQIQEFLGHKDHRRINSWLKDLVEKGYIERDFTPIYGTLTKPAVYTLSVKG
jgi:helix-turn-helix protein